VTYRVDCNLSEDDQCEAATGREVGVLKLEVSRLVPCEVSASRCSVRSPEGMYFSFGIG